MIKFSWNRNDTDLEGFSSKMFIKKSTLPFIMLPIKKAKECIELKLYNFLQSQIMEPKMSAL